MASVSGAMLAHITGGRRYCFVIMGFGVGYAFFERIRQLVSTTTGLECIRADDIPATSDSIRDKVHTCIDNAALIIADVSEATANIYYEVGYAAACRKPMIALAAEGKEIPTDLRGIETVPYTDSKGGWSRFETELRRHLAVHGDSSVSLSRAMVVPPEASPSYILASPKLPVEQSQFKFHPRERRTFGDNLGIVGIFGAFASVFGEFCTPELLSAEHVPDEIRSWDANLFFIGSPKVNPHAAFFMQTMQGGGAGIWGFERCPHDETRADWEAILTGTTTSGTFRTPCLHEPEAYRSPIKDYGLVMRGPNPAFPSRTVTIMAGPHSLGTAAACLAATRSPLIREISKRLESPNSLTCHDRLIWALVEGTTDDDGHISLGGVNIVDVGIGTSTLGPKTSA
jgi:hypothetical protein